MDTYNIDYEKICKPLELGLLLIPGSWSIYDARQICNTLRGNMNVISNEKNNDEITELMKKSETCLNHYKFGGWKSGGIWTGWWDEPTEGKWMSVSYSEPLNSKSFAPWHPGEPNGDTIENCACLHRFHFEEENTTASQWNDVDCNRKFCVACLIQTLPIFILRGIYLYHNNILSYRFGAFCLY